MSGVYNEHRDANRAMWDERSPAHAAAPEYAVQQLIADPNRLSDAVRFDVPRLGAVSGLRGVHLQCHIGTDTISFVADRSPHKQGFLMPGVHIPIVDPDQLVARRPDECLLPGQRNEHEHEYTERGGQRARCTLLSMA